MPKKTSEIRRGLYIFLTVAAILLFYDALLGRKLILNLWSQLITALQPIIIGAMLAYLLAPVVDWLENLLFRKAVEKTHGERKLVNKWVRAVSLTLTWAMIGALGYLLISILIPELYQSIMQLASNVETYYKTIVGWMAHLLENNPEVESFVSTQMQDYYKDTLKSLRTEVIPQAQVMVMALSGGIVSFLIFAKNLLIGIIVSIYFLITKELVTAHMRKISYSVFSAEQVQWVLKGAAKADHIFSGFVRGKLLDSLIIGVLCFLSCTALKIPYTPLVSVIVGVTNIIPFFGPFLGAIPSVFLILLVSPVKALYFLILILVLQQIDGNLIGPKILGDQTGLSGLWVIIAILVGGSFFGLAGMFFGVPVCACLYSLVTFLIDMRLQKKDLSSDTKDYCPQIPKSTVEEEKPEQE